MELPNHASRFLECCQYVRQQPLSRAAVQRLYNEFAQHVRGTPEQVYLDALMDAVQTNKAGLVPKTVLDLPASALDLSVRSLKVCERAGIETVRALALRTRGDMLRLKNCGDVSARELERTLHDRGVDFGTRLMACEGWLEDMPVRDIPSDYPFDLRQQYCGLSDLLRDSSAHKDFRRDLALHSFLSRNALSVVGQEYNLGNR